MPHERGPFACAPSEFSITTLADPKLASAARSPTVNLSPTLSKASR